ncbi:MAG: [protein-PII] uridylyltransferase family protein [Pirellulales bacterium]|jgi:glutamate-ammonia-ligase adenylyltransferase
MQVAQVIELLESPKAAQTWLAKLGVTDTATAFHSLLVLNEAGMTIDLVSVTLTQLEQILPTLAQPEQTLHALAQFISVSRNPISLGALWERDTEALVTLLTIFSISQHLSQLLIDEPECYDLLRITDGQRVDRGIILDEILNEVLSVSGDAAVERQLQRILHREWLRIAYGDLVRKQNPDTVLEQTSYLYEGLLAAAFQVAVGNTATTNNSNLVDQFVVIALGDLAADQMCYGDTVKIMMLYDGSKTATANSDDSALSDVLNKVLTKTLALLTSSTGEPLFTVDISFPLSNNNSPATNLNAAVRYLDFSGRTWQRCALIGARPCVGNAELGAEFLQRIDKWIYHRYLSRADMTGLRSLKRRLYRADLTASVALDIQATPGATADIVAVIQFIQLLNVAAFTNIRVAGTINAIAALRHNELLTAEEQNVLCDSYLTLKHIQHRLKIITDSSATALPQDSKRLQHLASSLGYTGDEQNDRLLNDVRHAVTLSRKILNRLLDDSFVDQEPDAPSEMDIVLDPHPSDQRLNEVLGKHNFRNVQLAHQYLTDLATERISFLSTRRCRHFLALIAPQLLEAVAQTPNPDSTLANLCAVSESLGGKGVLWELFQLNPPTLQLYVQLCSTSPYLSGILTSYPGMIDELMDSLILDQLPNKESLQNILRELTKSASLGGAPLIDVLQTFKHAQHLRVGVRDILGKDSLSAMHQSLSDIMDVCLEEVAGSNYEQLVDKYGIPTIDSGPHARQTAAFFMLAIGKLGGREPNFHSDAEILFLYDATGTTVARDRDHRIQTTSNQHFFNELAKRILKAVTRSGPHGRLFEMNSKLRATTPTGALAVEISEFIKFLGSDKAQVSHFLRLCNSRVVYQSSDTTNSRESLTSQIHQSIISMPRKKNWQREIYNLRIESEQGAAEHNLKRYLGGTMDVETIVQMLQLKHAPQHREILQVGTLAAMEQLTAQGCLSSEDAEALGQSYIFLREIEAGLRLMDTSARHDLPKDPLALTTLASLLGYESPQALVTICRRFRQDNRRRFNAILKAV